MQDAIGMIETKGLVALIEASDAMAKAANVEIIKRIQIGGGLVTTIVRGDVGSVRAAVEAGYSVVPVPGACAAITGLIASGLPMDRFSFEGALPRGRGARRSLFTSLESQEETCVFYESSHRILDSLQLLAEILPSRKLVLARELTKIHEEFLRGTASELRSRLAEDDRVRGEFVLIVEGSETSGTADQETIGRLLAELKIEDLPRKSIVRILANALGIPRNEAYRLVHRKDDGEGNESS